MADEERISTAPDGANGAQPAHLPDLFARQRADLAHLRGIGRYRTLSPKSGTDFSSNDYLGLAASDELNRIASGIVASGVPVGSGGSRLLRGNCPEHVALERFAADFFASESALFLSSGFAANSALFATLPQTGDLIVCDELIHASIHDGLRATRAAHCTVAHNDAAAFEDAARAWRRDHPDGRIWIGVESVYSMDGDCAPLADLAAIADRYDAILVIDEAHATGVLGPMGRGLSADLARRDNVISVHTCGKALGCEGALVCAPAVVSEFLVNRGRGFIFSTAPSPFIAQLVHEALLFVGRSDYLRAELAANVRLAAQLLEPLGALGGGHIVPLIVGDDRQTMAIAGALQDAGLDVRGIRPPTVPPGTGRLRISITRNVDRTDIVRLAELLADLLP
ncbi:8-amino-7-oxononanoate synthase [Tsuneonella suprasediminis]|uniref:8-amino-7-oxononanoate synthase n=1 Tax=Tsuneonella suprasediminis TaxID=2306996 RepID=UPI002F936D33